MTLAARRRVPESAVPFAVAAVAAAVTAWRVDVPSPWRDEIATWLAAGRPLPDLGELARTVDLVHLPYYLLAHAVLAVTDSILALRLLSVAAAAATAGTLVGLGTRLGSTRVGVTAGLLLAVSPLATRYGQEARPYALAALAATVAAWCLVGASTPGARRRPWLGYAAAVVATGLANVLALLVLAGHAAFVAGTRRPALRGWLLAVGGALVVLAPFLAATSGQAGQVGWLTRPGGQQLLDVLGAPFGSLLLPGLLLVVAVVRAARRPDEVHRPALVLGAAWGLLPPVLLWLGSQVHPLFDGRYAVAALPGACLALASLTPGPLTTGPLTTGPVTTGDRGRSARTLPAAALVAVLAVVGVGEQRAFRDPASGHGEDVRGLVRVLAADARPGDAVLFVPYHLRIVILLPDRDAGLRDQDAGLPARLPDDVALGRDALASATLSGEDVAAADVATRLAGRDRVWLVTGPAGTSAATTAADDRKVELLTRDFAEVRRTEVARFVITLHERR